MSFSPSFGVKFQRASSWHSDRLPVANISPPPPPSFPLLSSVSLLLPAVKTLMPSAADVTEQGARDALSQWIYVSHPISPQLFIALSLPLSLSIGISLPMPLFQSSQSGYCGCSASLFPGDWFEFLDESLSSAAHIVTWSCKDDTGLLTPNYSHFLSSLCC